MIGIIQHIYKVLSETTALTTIVGEKIFPLIIDSDVQAPVVVMQRSALSGNYSALGRVNDDCTVDVFCITDTYKEGITIADIIRTRLETYKDSNIISVRLIDCDESYDVTKSVYIQLIAFKIVTK